MKSLLVPWLAVPWLLSTCQPALGFMSHEFSSTRYFTDKGILPPLNCLVVPLNQTYQDDSTSYTDTSSMLGCEGSSVPVTYTNDPTSVYRWLSDHLPYQGGTIGFDVECRPRSRRTKGERSPFYNAATVQLATSDSCLVIHLARRSGKHSQACAPILKAVLCDEQFFKAGCALDDDLMSLYELWNGLDAKSRFDLGFLGGRSKRYGLKALTKGLLGVDLPKPREVTLSDWSMIPLNEHQIIYSARDAWAGAAIAKQLAIHDPTTFGHETLVKTLAQTEPSISELVDKQRRRDRAKKDLRKLLVSHPGYHGKDDEGLPEHIQSQVYYLRSLIKAPVIEPRLVFDVDLLRKDRT